MKGTARKLLSIVLALVMAAGIIPAAPAQAEGTLPEAVAPAPDAPAQTASTHLISYVRVNVDRFVQTTPDPGTRPILKNNNVELEWDVVPPSYALSVTATITDFYTNQSCTNRLTHQPISGDSYYTKLRVYVGFGNYTNYVADASRFDKSNVGVYCDGYEGKCVDKTYTTGQYGSVTIELTIRFTKGAEYSVRSFHVTAERVGENNGAYTVLGASTRIGWKDNKTPVANVYQLGNTSLCTTNACDNRLTTKPKMGETYYIKFTFQNIDSGKHYIDYDSITASDVSLTVPGYNCSVFSVQSGVERVWGGGDQMQVYDKLDIIFAVELESQYSLVGISATGSGIGRDGAQHTVLNFNPTITWKNNNAPASSKYRVVKSILYTDPALTSVAGAPTAGGTYYFSVRVINNIAGDNSIYFGEVDTGSCTLTVPGYTITRYTSYETTDSGKNGYRIIFKLVNNSKITLRSVAITATGAGYGGLKGESYTLAWDNGAPVSSAYGVGGFGVTYKDAACTQQAYSWDAGKSLYLKVTVRNAKYDNHDLDFAKLQKSNCSLTIPDIAASCVSVNAYSKQLGTSSSYYDVVDIVFKLTKAPYVAASFKDNLKNVKSRWNDGYEWYINANSFYGEFTWKDGRVPTNAQGHIEFDVSYLYEDEDCTSLYRGEALVDGDSYYVKYTIRNDNYYTSSVIDFSNLNATNCTLKLADSFDVEVVSVTTATTASYLEGYDADEVYIIFRLTRKPTYVLEGFAAVSGGLVRELGGYYRLQVEGKDNYTLTWKDGKAPASDDNWGVYDRYIYTDFECETKLTTEPQVGENYFVKLSVENDVRQDHSISFWELDRWSPLTLSLAGYECKLSNDPSYHVHPADDEHAWDRIYLIFRITKREQAIELLTEDGAPFTVGKVLRSEGMSRTAGGTGEPAGLGYDPDNISMTLLFSGASTPNDALTALNGATFERAARSAGGSIVFERLTGSISGNTMTLSHTSGDKTVPVMRILATQQAGVVKVDFTSLAPGAVRLTLEGKEYLLATPGDVNLDGTMNALDWITIMRWTLVASGGEYTSPNDEGFTINVDDTQYNLWVLLADMTDTETDNSKNSANWNAAVNAVDWITIMQLTLQAWK